MTIPATWEPLSDVDPVLAIAQDLFTTMIDGEPGHLYPWMGGDPELEDPRYAWVDVSGPVVTRVMLMADRVTGEHLTRGMLAMDEGEHVSDADFADAVGEIAKRRGEQARAWMWGEIGETLLAALKRHPGVRSQIADLERDVIAGRIPPAKAARRMIETFLSGPN